MGFFADYFRDCLRSDAGACKDQEPLSPVPIRAPVLSVTAPATQEPIEQLPMPSQNFGRLMKTNMSDHDTDHPQHCFCKEEERQQNHKAKKAHNLKRIRSDANSESEQAEFWVKWRFFAKPPKVTLVSAKEACFTSSGYCGIVDACQRRTGLT
jgi:hypothetical protein